MQVKDVMTPRVQVVHPDSTIEEAACKMKEHDVGSLPVCDGERLVGMITDRDITVRATAEAFVPGFTKVRQVMTEDVQYCFDDDDLRAGAEIMEKAQIRRLPVIDREKRLVGIVALADLAARSEEDEISSDVLEEVSQPAGARS